MMSTFTEKEDDGKEHQEDAFASGYGFGHGLGYRAKRETEQEESSGKDLHSGSAVRRGSGVVEVGLL